MIFLLFLMKQLIEDLFEDEREKVTNNYLATMAQAWMLTI